MANTKVSTGGFSPERLAKTLQEYNASLRLTSKEDGYKVDCADAAADYEKSRKPDFYKAIKLASGTTVDEQLNKTHTEQKNTDAVKSIREGIEKALTITDNDEIKKEITKFKTTVDRLNNRLNDKKAGHVEGLAVTDIIVDLRNKFVDKMKEQQTKELKALDDVFKNIDNCNIAFGVDSEEKVNAIKVQLKNELEKGHKDQRSAFENPVNKAHNQVHIDLAKDLRRVYYLNTMQHYRNDKNFNFIEEFKRSGLFSATKVNILNSSTWTWTPFDAQAPVAMQKDIKEIIKKNNQEAEAAAAAAGTTIEYGKKENKGSELKDIDLDKIEHLQTTTGRNISKLDINGNKLSITLPSLSKWDWWSPHNKEDLGNDMLSAMQLIAAAGHDSIIITIDCKNSEAEKEFGQMAYEQALKAGFAPDKISINMTVNGTLKMLKGQELRDHLQLAPEVLKEAEKTQQSIKSVLEDLKTKHATEEGKKALMAELETDKYNNNPPTT